MQKKVTIITIILVLILFLGTVVGLYLAVSSDFNKRSTEIATDIENVQSELDALKAAKDDNGFTPTEVVKAFFYDVKSDSNERAKLYLSPEIQTMDTKATLKLGSDYTNISTGENIEEANGEDVSVLMTFVLADEETTVRTFELSKYDGAWKIMGVVVE